MTRKLHVAYIFFHHLLNWIRNSLWSYSEYFHASISFGSFMKRTEIILFTNDRSETDAWICANERRFVIIFFIIFLFLIFFHCIHLFASDVCGAYCILVQYSVRVNDLGLIRYSLQTCIAHTPVIAMLQLFRSGSLSVVDYVKKCIRLLFDHSLWLKAKELKLVKSTKVRRIGQWFFFLFLSFSSYYFFSFSFFRAHTECTKKNHNTFVHMAHSCIPIVCPICDSYDLYKNMI